MWKFISAVVSVCVVHFLEVVDERRIHQVEQDENPHGNVRVPARNFHNENHAVNKSLFTAKNAVNNLLISS